MSFRIDKDVPIPASRIVIGRYPLDALEIGDSFFAPGVKAQSLSAAANRREGKNFTVRTVQEQVDGIVVKGARIWRVS